MASVAQSLPATQFNPYANDQTNASSHSAAFYQGQSGYSSQPAPAVSLFLSEAVSPY
jgi:hypothetical protein